MSPLEKLASDKNLTPFELITKAYTWRWGVSPLARTVIESIQRADKTQTVPQVVSEYLGKSPSSLPQQALPF